MATVEHTHYIIGSVVGPAPVSDDGPRFPVGDRPRDTPAVPGADRPSARRGRGLRRRRQQLGRHVLSVRRPMARSSWSASRPAAAAPAPGEHAATLGHGQPGVLHGSFSYVLQDAGRPDRATCIPSRPDSIIPASAPNTATGRTAAASATPASAMTMRCKAFSSAPAWKAFCPPWRRPTPWSEAMRIAARRAKEDVVVRLLLRPRRQGLLRGGPAGGRGDLILSCR